jgi:hypothetical protein
MFVCLMVVVLFFWLQECMQSNLQKAHVLYARVEADEQARCLLQICSIHNVRPSDVMHLSPLEGGWEWGVGHHQFSCTHALHYWIKALPWVTIKWLLNTIVDVLTGAFVESGLVLQKDQEHSLKVRFSWVSMDLCCVQGRLCWTSSKRRRSCC